MGRVEGKVAIVTGAAMGLGRAQAVLLAREGATVIATDINAAEGRGTVAVLDRKGVFVTHDVSREESWAELEEVARERFGGVDILVNNAAIMIPGGIEDLTMDAWRRVQSVNADGVFLGCRAGVRLMKERGGSIVNIASVASHSGEAFAAAYSASKGAVRALTKSVAVYCQQAGYAIRCNSVHPGVMDTPMVRSMREARGQTGAPPGAGDPTQLAYAVLYLASDEAQLVTGAELIVDNGRTVTPPAPK
ncbi:MAG: SDR family oxidoreductase [Hyphomonadaceae bacterium]